jgi:hypothetical protein
MSGRGDFSSADFSIQIIRILRYSGCPVSVSMNLDDKRLRRSPMNSEFPTPPKPLYAPEELEAPSSRLLDEKISDNSATEAKVNSVFKPAGLKNPFWK